MPEETQTPSENTSAAQQQPAVVATPTENSTSTDTKTPNPKPKAQGNSKKKIMLIVIGVVVFFGLVIAAILAAIFVFNAGSGNARGGDEYSATDPGELTARLNSDFKQSIETAATAEGIQENPFAALNTTTEMQAPGTAQKFDLNLAFSGTEISEGLESSGEIKLAGNIVYGEDTVNMDGNFNFAVGASGFTVTQSGEFRLVGTDFYLNLDEGLLSSSIGLPEGWLVIGGDELTDVYNDASLQTPTSEEDMANLEQTLEEIRAVEGDLLINPTSIENRDIEGVSVPCMQAEVNKDYVLALLASAQDTTVTQLESGMEFSYQFQPVVICIDGLDKPAYYSFGMTTTSPETGEAEINFTFELSPLSEAPSIVAPPESEVTNLDEYYGGSTGASAPAGSPAGRINATNDSLTRNNVQALNSALVLYEIDNGELPMTQDGAALPTVSSETAVVSEGVSANELSNISDYLPSIPTSADGQEIYIGLLSDGTVVTGTTLSDGSIYTSTI